MKYLKRVGHYSLGNEPHCFDGSVEIEKQLVGLVASYSRTFNHCSVWSTYICGYIQMEIKALLQAEFNSHC